MAKAVTVVTLRIEAESEKKLDLDDLKNAVVAGVAQVLGRQLRYGGIVSRTEDFRLTSTEVVFCTTREVKDGRDNP